MSKKRFNPHQTVKAKKHRDDLKRFLLGEMQARGKWSVQISDEELAERTSNSPRTVRRYLEYWRDVGVLETRTIRYKFPNGWANRRVISLTRDEKYRIIESLKGDF